MNYTNVVIFILATCYFVDEVNTQRGRHKWRRPKLGGGRRRFGQVNNPNRGPVKNAGAMLQQPQGNRVQIIDPTDVWSPNSGQNAGRAAVNHGRMGNAITIQDEAVRQELNAVENGRIVIIDPTQQMPQSQTGTAADENSNKDEGWKSAVRKNRNGKRAERRLENTARNRKIKKLTKEKKRMKKQRKLLKAESVGQSSLSVKESKKQKRVANKWMKRRQKMLDRMRARKAKLNKKKKKKAEIRTEKQHLNEITAKNAASVKISPVVKDGANVPSEIDRKVLEIPELKGMSDSNKNNTETNDISLRSESIGSGITVNGSRIPDTFFAVSRTNTGPSDFNVGVNTETGTSKNVENSPRVNSGTLFDLETQGNQIIEPNAGNAVFVRPVVPGFAVNNMSGMEPIETRNPQWQAGVTVQEIDIPAFLASVNSDGILPTDNEMTGQGVPLGPFDPRTGVLSVTEETGLGGSLRIVDAQTGVLLGPADIGMRDSIGPIDPRTGVLRAPFGPGDSGIDASLEQIDNRKDTATASVALAESTTANTPTSGNSSRLDSTNMGDSGTGFQIEPGSLLTEVILDSANFLSDLPAGRRNVIENRNSLTGMTSDIPLGPVSFETDVQKEPIDTNNAQIHPINREADVQESVSHNSTSKHSEAEISASSSGLGVNNAGEAVGQISSGMEGTPLGPIEIGVGNPLGASEIDTQNNAGEAVGQIGSGMEGTPLSPIEIGVGNPLGAAEIDTQNNAGEAVGQIGSGMEGTPLGPIEIGVGIPLGAAEIDTQNNVGESWVDPSFGTSQAAILQSVDLRDFFSTGEVNFLQTDPALPDQPEPAQDNGIQTVNGEIMPVAGQSSGVPAVGSSRTEPDRSSFPSDSLLGFVFDISRALRPG